MNKHEHGRANPKIISRRSLELRQYRALVEEFQGEFVAEKRVVSDCETQVKQWSLAINMAMTMDARIASSDRRWTVFGTSRDHANLLRLRAQSDAVICGARTVDGDLVTMNAGGEKYRRQRRRRSLAAENLRVIVTARGTLDPRARVFESPGGEIIVCVSSECDAERRRALERVASQVWVLGESEIDLRALLARLVAERGGARFLCEGGARLNESFLRAGLVDRLHLTLCPWLIGGRDAPNLAEGVGFEALADAYAMEFTSVKRKGREVYVTLEKRRPIASDAAFR